MKHIFTKLFSINIDVGSSLLKFTLPNSVGRIRMMSDSAIETEIESDKLFDKNFDELNNIDTTVDHIKLLHNQMIAEKDSYIHYLRDVINRIMDNQNVIYSQNVLTVEDYDQIFTDIAKFFQLNSDASSSYQIPSDINPNLAQALIKALQDDAIDKCGIINWIENIKLSSNINTEKASTISSITQSKDTVGITPSDSITQIASPVSPLSTRNIAEPVNNNMYPDNSGYRNKDFLDLDHFKGLDPNFVPSLGRPSLDNSCYGFLEPYDVTDLVISCIS